MMIDTARKFGYPKRLLYENEHWLLLLRPHQITLGSMVAVSKTEAESLGGVSEAAFTAFPEICRTAENVLKRQFGAKKFNYLALMMVDPQVHFHLIPRYDSPVHYLGENFVDTNWPKPVNILDYIDLSESKIEQLCEDLKSAF